MKYIDLIVKLILWNLLSFIGFIVVAAFFVGEPVIILMGAFSIAPVIGTIIGITKYLKNQKKKNLSDKILHPLS